MTRDGAIHGTEDSQDRLTTFLYNSRIGNLTLKVLTLPCLSKLAGAFLSTPLSALLIDSFIKKNGISLEDCEPKKYTSFNDFFTRELKPEARLIDFDPNHAVQSVFWDGDALIICRKSSVKFDYILISGKDNAVVYEMPDTEESKQFWEDVCQNQRILIETVDYDYQYADGSLLRIDRRTGENEVITADDKWQKISWNFSGILFLGTFAAIFIYEQVQKKKRRQNTENDGR